MTYDALHFEGARRVMDAAERAGVSRFVLMSANGVRADGTAYQRTKYLAEQYLTTTTLDWTVFRPSVLFGDPRGRMEFATLLLRGIINSPLPAPLFYQGLLPFAAGQFCLSPVHVADVAQAFVNALPRTETHRQVMPLGGPDALIWRNILTTIAQAAGKRKLMLPAPAWGVSTAAALLDRFDAFPITRDQIRMLMEGNACGTDAFGLLGIEPVAFNAQQLRYLATPQQRPEPWQQNVV